MLGAFEAGRIAAEFLVAKSTGGHAQAVHITRGQAHRAAQANKQGVQVGTFATQVAGFQHGLDVALATTTHLGFAVGVGDNPVVQLLGLLHIGVGTTNRLLRGLPYDAVNRHQLGGLGPVIERGGVYGGNLALRPVHGTVAGLNAAGQLDKRQRLVGRKFHKQHARTVLVVVRHLGFAVARKTADQRLLPVAVNRRDGQPDAGDALRFDNIDPGGDVKGAPAAGFWFELARRQRRSLCKMNSRKR